MVRTDETLEPIPFATVEIMELGRRLTANGQGVYAFPNVPAGRWTLVANALGYAHYTASVEVAHQSVRLDILLKPEPIALPELVTETRMRAKEHIRILGSEIRQAPRVLESDVLRALVAVPAVQFASDYSAGLYIRGGTPDQTAINVDGMPLLNPYHLGGAITAVDPDAVASVDVFPGAAPASLGDRIAGYVNITTREGAKDRLHSAGGVGLASTRFSLEGPIMKRGSFILAARRTYLDLLSAAAMSIGIVDDDVPYAFTDAHLKATYEFGYWDRMVFAGYLNSEKYARSGHGSAALDAKWGSRALSYRYERILHTGWQTRAQFSVSTFDARASYLDQTVESLDSLDAEVSTALYRLDLSLTAPLHWLFGLQVESFGTKASITSAGTDMPKFFPPLIVDRRLTSLAAFSQYEARVTDRTHVRLGVRSFHSAGGQWRLLPRLSAQYDMSGSLSVTLGAGLHTQAITTLRNEESALARVFAYDISIPVTEYEPLLNSQDVVLGIRANMGAISVTVDAFAKSASKLLLPPLPADPQESAVLTTERALGSARAYGLEITAAKHFGQLDMRVLYAGISQSYSVGAQTYTPSFHRSHNFNLHADYMPGAAVIGLRAVWQSGLPYTPGIAVLRTYRSQPDNEPPYVPAGEIVLLGQHNSGRLPAYSRIDVAVRNTYETSLFGKRVSLTPYLDIYNVLNSHNVLWGIPRSVNEQPRLEYGPQLPFLPTIGVEWKF